MNLHLIGAKNQTVELLAKMRVLGEMFTGKTLPATLAEVAPAAVGTAATETPEDVSSAMQTAAG